MSSVPNRTHSFSLERDSFVPIVMIAYILSFIVYVLHGFHTYLLQSIFSIQALCIKILFFHKNRHLHKCFTWEVPILLDVLGVSTFFNW